MMDNEFKWMENIQISYSKSYLPKVGDKVTTRPGFNIEWDNKTYVRSTDDLYYGGAGYQEYHTFVVRQVTNQMARPVIWPENNGGGIYVDALKPYEDE